MVVLEELHRALWVGFTPKLLNLHGIWLVMVALVQLNVHPVLMALVVEAVLEVLQLLQIVLPLVVQVEMEKLFLNLTVQF